MPDLSVEQPVPAEDFQPASVDAPVPATEEFSPAPVVGDDVEAPTDFLAGATAQEIADMAINNPGQFDLTSELSQREDLQKDPAMMDKFAEALDLVTKAPVYKGLPGPKKVGETVWNVAKGMYESGVNLAEATTEAAAAEVARATGAAPTDAVEEAERDVQKRFAEAGSAAEGGLTGIVRQGAQLLEKPGRTIAKVFGAIHPWARPVTEKVAEALPSSPENRTHQDKLNLLFEKLAQAKQSEDITKGKGALLQAIGPEVMKNLEAHGQGVDPEKVARMEAGEPFSWYAFGKAMAPFHAVVGGIAALTPSMEKVVGKTISTGATAAKPVAKVAMPAGGAVTGGIAGGSAGMLTAVPGAGTVAGAYGGFKLGQKLFKSTAGVLDVAKKVGAEIAGAPTSNAYTLATRNILKQTPRVIRPLLEGAGMDLGIAAVADTPSERQGVGLGVAFGLLGAAKAAPGAAWKVLAGQLIDPRSYKSSNSLPSSGRYSALDAAHTAAFNQMPVESRGLVNSLRFLLKGVGSDADIFAVPADEGMVKDFVAAGMSEKAAREKAEDFAISKALLDSGMDKGLAEAYGQQRAGTIKMPDGRDVVFLRSSDVQPAPHEIRHVFERVLGEQFMRGFDQEVRSRYGDDAVLEAAVRYGNQLGGGSNWLESILVSTGRGEKLAGEKLLSELIEETREEFKQNGWPEPTEAELQTAVSNLAAIRAGIRADLASGMSLDDVISKSIQKYGESGGGGNIQEISNRFRRLAQDWNEILTPEEQFNAGLDYTAREIGAENFSAWFNRVGPDLTTGGQIPDVIANWIASGMDKVGANALAGERSKGSVPVELNFGVAKATGEQAKGLLGKKPVIEPESPRTPARESSDEAARGRDIVDGAPDEVMPGANQSIKEMLGNLVSAIADKVSVVVNYRSAPDQPAAGSTVEGLTQGMDRSARRAIIEAWRYLPESTRQLVERVFSPEKVRNTSKGYQVYGAAPQVVAANAQKLAEFALRNPDLRLPTEYELDPDTGSFTTIGWNNLLADVATYSQNHSRGYTGSGERLQVPGSVTAKDYFAPPVTGEATPLAQNRADVVAALFGYHTPENATIVKAGKLPLNIVGQRVSEATMPGRLSGKKAQFGAPEQSQEQQTRAQELGITGEAIREANPFVEDLNQRPNPPSFVEAKQWMNLEHMADVTVSPEQARLEQNTLTAAAGFMPKTEAGRELEKKGFSMSRVVNGDQLTYVVKDSKAGVAALLEAAVLSRTTATVDRVTVSPDVRRQGIGEALYREMATDLQERGITKLSGFTISQAPVGLRTKVFGEPTGDFNKETGMGRVVNKIPADAKFMAKTEAGKDLEKRGFTLSRIKNETTGVMSYEATPAGAEDSVATLEIYRSKPDTAHVAFVSTGEAYKKQGIAETLYREMATDLQEQGITKLTGDVVHAAPLHIRESLFGNTRIMEGPTDPRESASYVRRVENEIAPGVQFMPRPQEPKAIKSAAVRDEETGKVYEGPFHGAAQVEWFADKFPGKDVNDDAVLDMVLGSYDRRKLTDGFTTNEGEFLDRTAAYDRAASLKQINDSKYRKEVGLSPSEHWLESMAFNEERKFMPRRDEEYLKAANSGDIETAQRLVDEAAKAAGYAVGPVWRGEQGGDRPNVYTRRERREPGIFTTDQKDIAAGYDAEESPRRFYLGGKVLDLTSDTPEAVAWINRWAKDADWDFVDRYSGEKVHPVDAVTGGNLFDWEGDWSEARWKDLQATAASDGYGVAILNDLDNISGVFKSFVALDSNKIKSADAVTRDDSGKIIPVSQRFNPENPDVRYMPKADKELVKHNDEEWDRGVRENSSDPGWWIDKNGKLLSSPEDHELSGRKILKMRPLDEDQSYKGREAMFAKGWSRVVYEKREPRTIFLDPGLDNRATNREQIAALTRIAIEKGVTLREDRAKGKALYEPPQEGELSAMPKADRELSKDLEKETGHSFLGEASFSVRKEEPPKKTVTAYKLLRVKKSQPGKLFPLFADADKETPVGVWLDADIGKTAMAVRPGWHFGDLPDARHIGKKGPDGKIDRQHPDTVWVEAELAADVDWQTEANNRAKKNAKGEVIPRTAQIVDEIPKNGYYRYKTNPNMPGEWMISGAMKITKVLTDAEVDQILRDKGVEPLPREGGPMDLEKWGLKPTGEASFMAKKSKDDYKFPTGAGTFSKAWILPNGRPVQLGGKWHHDYLNENAAALKKAHGLKLRTSGQDNRTDALKAGFARVNYDKNRGELTVEARHQDWQKIKNSVLELVKTNIDSIDSMQVNLLDKEVRRVIESDGVNLFSYDKSEKLDHIPLITERTAPTVSMSAQASSEGSFMAKMTDKNIEADVEKVRAGTFEGQTYNADGTAWNPGESKNDIVTLASRNFKQEDLTTEAIKDYLQPYDQLLDDPGIKMGMFPFEQDGTKMVSVDVNAVVPQEHRANSVAFAKANDQVAIFDAVKFENVETGGKGNTKLSKPGEMLDAVQSLTKGEPVNVEEIIRQNKEAAPEQEQEALPTIGAPKRALSTAEVANMTKAQLAAHYPESVIPKTRDEPIMSDIIGSPLYKQAKTRENAVKVFAKKLVEFARQYEKEPAYQDGLRWYSEFTPMLHRVYGKSAQLMAELLAATSPNTTPQQNFELANEAVVMFNKGAFKKQIAKFEEGLDMIKNNSWRPWLDAEAAAGKIKLPVKVTAATFMNHWYDAQDLAPRKSNGKLFGMNSQAVMKVYARQWLQNTEGPKTQNFVQNLLGIGHGATIDVWADRTMRRIGYSGFKSRWRILPKNSRGITDPDFYFGQEAFRAAAKELGILPDALQGALWFAEKKLWADNGWGRLDLGSYQKEFAKVPTLDQKIETNMAPKTEEAPQGDLFVGPRKVKQ